jgi:hypothetical protein
LSDMIRLSHKNRAPELSRVCAVQKIPAKVRREFIGWTREQN